MKPDFAMILVTLFAIGVPGCVEALETPTPSPEAPTATMTPETPESPTLTATARIFGITATVTESEIPPSPTLHLNTPLPTEFATPTPIGGTSTGIIEVTPLGGSGDACDFREAYFTPTSRMKVRNAASLDGGIVGYLEIGQRTAVCNEVFVVDQHWLCIDFEHDLMGNIVGSDCQRVVAYQIGEVIYGRLEIIQP